jgi:hypothetical protein
MAKAKNTFLGSKMNKDIDARILQNGDYRDALNVQISRSEGDGVGSLENVLGNSLAVNFESLTGVSNLTCIGYCADEINNNIYLFLTDYTDPSPLNLTYSTGANNFIYSYNTVTQVPSKLVEGPFLNFSKTHFIYAVNVLENLLFWTDNRNQPRKINITSALGSSTFYTTEDQISVSTYNPYQAIQLYRQSLSTGNVEAYETTMLDVVSKFYPNGGSGTLTATSGVAILAGTSIPISNVKGNIYIGSEVQILDSNLGITVPTVTEITYTSSPTQVTEIKLSAGFTPTANNPEIVFEPNPYYDASYNGDPNYLEDKFVRFGYRFNYVDGENSIFSPFTQPTFIPKQDGYFVTDTTKLAASPTTTAGDVFVSREKDDQELSYQSTIVEFMENKVNKILLYIPLPFNNYDLQNALKIDSIDILYKESNQSSVKVIEQVSIETIFNSAAQAQVNGAVASSAGPFAIDNIQGGIQIGAQVTGGGITVPRTVTAFVPTDPNNPVSGNITLNGNVTLANDAIITIGNPKFYVYDYQSRKPFKALPEADLIRVYDKTPVRSLAQEVTGNRVVYGNFQNKHTPPAFIDYNVNTSQKAIFNINFGDADVSVGIVAGKTITVTPKGFGAVTFWSSSNVVGSTIVSFSSGAVIPPGTLVDSFNYSTGVLTVTNNITIAALDTIELSPASGVQDTSSIIEYPNHSLKQNRNYQVGVVLSDRFGRQSSVILSNSLNIVTIGTVDFKGSTIYSDYNSSSVEQATWPGDSLKISFNSPIGPSNKNISTGWPGLYNGVPSSSDYNPLGWYSWKIVVKQTEQEYYNVYLPGIMASYPNDTSLELGRTSHTVLINDNINKIPRDLNEVGPQQKQFRSSVQVFGRVENDVTAPLAPAVNNSKNTPYFPGIKPDTVSTISTLNDLFDFNALVAERPDFFPQFYVFDSNPLIGRITTENKIGQIASTEFDTASGIIDLANTPSAAANQVTLLDVQGTITIGMLVRGGGLAEGTNVAGVAGSVVTLNDAAGNPANIGTVGPPKSNIFSQGDVLTFFDDPNTNTPGIQYLAVYETEPVESLLDIFWETSSSGLIEELNTAILSDNLSASTLSGFNDTNFNEGLQVGQRVGSTAPGFTATNVFGVPLAAADFQITLESQFADDFAIADLTGADRTSDFTLVDLGAPGGTGPNPGFYQLQTASLFVFLEDSAIRNFNVSFKITSLVDGSFNFFEETMELKNIAPAFDLAASTPTNPLTANYTIPPISYPAATTAPITPTIIMGSGSTVAISKLVANNGSRFYIDGTSGAGGTKFNAGRELIFEIVNQVRADFLMVGFGNIPQYTEQQYIDRYAPPGYLPGTFIGGGPFSITETIATTNTTPDGIVDGKSFLSLIREDISDPNIDLLSELGIPNTQAPFITDDYVDYVVWVKVTDASGSSGSSESPVLSPAPNRLVIRISKENFTKGLFWTFTTPKNLNLPAVGASSVNTVIDSTCTVTVVDATTFTTATLTGDNVFYGFSVIPSAQIPLQGPIFCLPTGDLGNSNDVYNLPDSTTSNSYLVPPNSVILNSAGVNSGVRVSTVEYTGTPSGSDFGPAATVTTFAPHGLSTGDQINFSTGRWAVTMPNVAGTNFTSNVFPRVHISNVFPFYSTTNPTQQASTSELCAQVTNASPRKNGTNNTGPACEFVSQPEEVNNVAPLNPFLGINSQQLMDSFVASVTYGCAENCVSGE